MSDKRRYSYNPFALRRLARFLGANWAILTILFLLIVYMNGLRGKYSAQSHWGVEACALYWHFVDVVWVFFYAALYLIGSVA